MHLRIWIFWNLEVLDRFGGELYSAGICEGSLGVPAVSQIRDHLLAVGSA